MAKELAKALLYLEEGRVASTALASTGGNLRVRIERLLAPERINSTRVRFRPASSLHLLVSGVILIASALSIFHGETKSTSSATEFTGPESALVADVVEEKRVEDATLP